MNKIEALKSDVSKYIEDIVGVERTFPFNYDVITPEDDELKSILRELSIQKICFNRKKLICVSMKRRRDKYEVL